jgi:hypothetical protein
LDGEVRAAYLEDWPDEDKAAASIQRLERYGTFSYRGVGRVVDQQEGLIEVKGFIIDFGDLPWDGAVEFVCTRIDLC